MEFLHIRMLALKYFLGWKGGISAYKDASTKVFLDFLGWKGGFSAYKDAGTEVSWTWATCQFLTLSLSLLLWYSPSPLNFTRVL